MSDLSLAQWLKSEREKQGFSIEQINQKTRIPTRFVQAMEDGCWNVFPAEVYRIGFLRDYAEFLKLNVEDVLQLYRQNVGEVALPKSNLAVDVSLEKIKIASKIRNLQIVFLIFLLILGVFLGRRFVHLDKSAAVLDPQTDRPGLYLLSLKVKVKDSVWMRAQGDDDRLIFEGLVNPSDDLTWNSVRQMIVRIGNIRAVSLLQLNGKSFTAQARPKSAVVELLLDQDALNYVQSTDQPVLQSVYTSTQTVINSAVESVDVATSTQKN